MSGAFIFQGGDAAPSGGKSAVFCWTGTLSTAVGGTSSLKGPSDTDPFDETWNKSWGEDQVNPDAAGVNDLFTCTVPFAGTITDFAINSRCNGGGTLVCDIDIYKLVSTDNSTSRVWTKIGTIQSWVGTESVANVFVDTGAFSSGNAVAAGDVICPIVYITTGVSASLTLNASVTLEGA